MNTLYSTCTKHNALSNYFPVYSSFLSSEIPVFRLIRCDTIFSFHSARCCIAAIRPAVCHFDMTEQQVPLLLLPHFSWNEEGRRKGRPLTRWWMGELKNSLGAPLSIHISFSIGANVSPPFRQNQFSPEKRVSWGCFSLLSGRTMQSNLPLSQKLH